MSETIRYKYRPKHKRKPFTVPHCSLKLVARVLAWEGQDSQFKCILSLRLRNVSESFLSTRKCKEVCVALRVRIRSNSRPQALRPKSYFEGRCLGQLVSRSVKRVAEAFVCLVRVVLGCKLACEALPHPARRC